MHTRAVTARHTVYISISPAPSLPPSLTTPPPLPSLTSTVEAHEQDATAQEGHAKPANDGLLRVGLFVVVSGGKGRRVSCVSPPPRSCPPLPPPIPSNQPTWDRGIASKVLSHARVKVMVGCCAL